MTSPSPPGWFGKIPNLGDFVTRRLPDGFVRPWDEWLQHGLASMRTRTNLLADESPSAAICRFWIGPGVVGTPAWIGVLTPSADRVGRRFPLTIAAPIDPQTPPGASLAGALAAHAWFAALDDIVQQTRDPRCGAEAIEAALAGMRERPMAETADTEFADALLRPRCGTRTDAPPAGQSDSSVVPASAACSVWWHVAARSMADYLPFPGLPPPEALAGLLDARSETGFSS